MTHSTGKTCVDCAKIDFEFFTKRTEHVEVEPCILWPVITSDCLTCQLLQHCIEGSGDKISSREVLRGVYTGHELQLYIDTESTTRRLDYSIRLCDAVSSSGDVYSSSCFDIKELMRWLMQCDTIHQCLPSVHQALPKDFRLIDVHNYCIVQPKEHVKYCVLSYVWGEIEQPMLTLCNKADFESKHFLKTQRFPKTILDAMGLCREIKCRYLWVDSLCIIQDCADSKHKQISAMAEVYSQSFLAFIATAGGDSEAGLPPYGMRRNPVSYMARRTSKGTFVASFSPQIAAHEIAKSTWASRGWTLQEYALPRRVLFFTGSYVFLRCEKGLRCEDFGLGFSNCFEQDRKWDLPLPPFYRRTQDKNRHYPPTFSQLLAHYLRRTLRFEEDILNAFTGILTRMERPNGLDLVDSGIGDHVWGLPSIEFGAALQWSTNAPWPRTERVGFPSWSWAGWIHDQNPSSSDGEFADIYDGHDSVHTVSVLTWRKYHDDKSIHMGDTFERNLYRFGEEIRYFSPGPLDEIESFIERSQFSTPLSHHIFIWASCASLYVDRSQTSDFSLRIKPDSREIGRIRIRPEWREHEPDCMEFFVSTVDMSYGLKFKLILVKPHSKSVIPVYKRIQVSHAPVESADWALANPRSHVIALV